MGEGQNDKNSTKGGEESSQSQTNTISNNKCIENNNNVYFIISSPYNKSKTHLSMWKKGGGKEDNEKREGESKEKHFNKRFVFMQ